MLSWLGSATWWTNIRTSYKKHTVVCVLYMMLFIVTISFTWSKTWCKGEEKYLERGVLHLALMGKFWLRSRISFKESNFGTDKILDAACKLRSAGRVTVIFSFEIIRGVWRRVVCRHFQIPTFQAKLTTQLSCWNSNTSTLHFPHFEGSHFAGALQEVPA